ncbi:hypothetical protein LWI29_014187 [Acer saccharum]|uniref:Uncharacterized protein n=1 Tax=Acer saccharum TaxID=4024 RepID=A0AA39SXV6_ACESA|nr:hypothetical protein LWI29_014187 [Acer saccharum]
MLKSKSFNRLLLPMLFRAEEQSRLQFVEREDFLKQSINVVPFLCRAALIEEEYYEGAGGEILVDNDGWPATHGKPKVYGNGESVLECKEYKPSLTGRVIDENGVTLEQRKKNISDVVGGVLTSLLPSEWIVLLCNVLIRSPNGGTGTRLIRAIQAFQTKLGARIKELRKDLPMKVFFFLVGFYCATAFATVIGRTGDWDILSAALAVVVVEGMGALMYKGYFPLLNKIRSLITVFNYWKVGLSLGLFLDSFKYEMDNIIGSTATIYSTFILTSSLSLSRFLFSSSLCIRFELSKMECDGDVGEVEGYEANFCRGFTEQRAVDINGCLLQSVIPENKRSMTPNAQLTVFRAESLIPMIQ